MDAMNGGEMGQGTARDSDDSDGSHGSDGSDGSDGRSTAGKALIVDCSGWAEHFHYTGESFYFCCACGAGLGPDPDDTPHAEGQDRHLCGNCYRGREWDAIMAFEGGL
jgi:hypothetical protein